MTTSNPTWPQQIEAWVNEQWPLIAASLPVVNVRARAEALLKTGMDASMVERQAVEHLWETLEASEGWSLGEEADRAMGDFMPPGFVKHIIATSEPYISDFGWDAPYHDPLDPDQVEQNRFSRAFFFTRELIRREIDRHLWEMVNGWQIDKLAAEEKEKADAAYLAILRSFNLTEEEANELLARDLERRRELSARHTTME